MSKKYHLVPFKLSGSGNIMSYKHNTVKRLSWTYLHGNLEEKACEHDGYDIYGIKGDMPNSEGIHKGYVEYPDGKIDCTIFLWEDPCLKEKLMGLVVANDDKKSFNDAKSKYEKKVSNI